MPGCKLQVPALTCVGCFGLGTQAVFGIHGFRVEDSFRPAVARGLN